VHNALAAYYHPTDSQDPVAHVHASIATDLEQFPVREDDLHKEEELCSIMLEGYLLWLV
jgi:hypothetical protein